LRRFALYGALAVIGLLISPAANAIDHNNLEFGRSLRFDDAFSIAFGERSWEVGFGLGLPKKRSARYEAHMEFKYGFAPNRDVGISVEPAAGGGTDGRSNRFDVGNVALSYFHGFQREIGNAPALAYRVDVEAPTGRDEEGVRTRLRGIMTRTLRQYDKLHLNLDVNWAAKPGSGERRSTIAAVVGYSAPVGFPRRFDTTMLAQFALAQSPMRGEGWTGTVGMGIRRQTGVRSVVDVGIESDVFAPSGARTPFRFVAGYSVGY